MYMYQIFTPNMNSDIAVGGGGGGGGGGGCQVLNPLNNKKVNALPFHCECGT